MSYLDELAVEQSDIERDLVEREGRRIAEAGFQNADEVMMA